MPVLNLTFRVDCGKDVSGLEIGILRSPRNIGKGGLLAVV